MESEFNDGQMVQEAAIFLSLMLRHRFPARIAVASFSKIAAHQIAPIMKKGAIIRREYFFLLVRIGRGHIWE